MAMSLAAEQSGPIADLNTTPLIDVMLVLLVMFILTMPLQTHSVKVDLPTPGEGPKVDSVINRITIDTRDQVTWNGKPTDLATLSRALDASKAIIPAPELQIDPDPASRYELTNRVLAVVKRSEVGKVGFVHHSGEADFLR